MKPLSFHNRRPPCAPGLLLIGMTLAFPLAAGAAPPPQNPSPQTSPTTPAPPVSPMPGAVTPAVPPDQATSPQGQPLPSEDGTRLGPPSLPTLEILQGEDVSTSADGTFSARNVQIRYAGTTLTADRVEGDFDRELVFSGHAKIEGRNLFSYADAIHLYPRTRSYRLDNPRAVLQPELLENRVLDPVFVFGGEFGGTRAGYTDAEKFIATTCIEPSHHYELRVGSAELFPHKRLILRRVGVVFFGRRLITLPTLVIPLDRNLRRPRTDYLPEFGQNIEEGYYARFPYTFAIGAAAAALLRFDATQKRGEGYRIEQEYLAGKQSSAFDTSGYGGSGGYSGGFGTPGGNGAITSAYGYGTLGPRLPRLGTGLGPTNGGLFAMQGYFNDGFRRNFNASFRHQQGIGSNNRFALLTEMRRNSFYTSQDQTSQNTRFTFSHNDSTHGVNADLALGLATNDSSGFSTNQLTGSLRHSFDFASVGSNRNSLSYSFDFNRYLSESSGTFGSATQRTARLDSQFQFQHVSRDYSFSAQANKSTPVGKQSSTGTFGTLERLPELQFSADTINFKGGWLRSLPLHLDIGAGRYSEPSSNIATDRVLLGLTLQDTPIMRGNTEMTFGGGFEQRMYGDGAAQYIVRNTTRLRQHLGGRSGFDISYQYQQPEGGTPFFFDTFGASHYITGEAGYLDDQHFQLTARVGYDFLGTSRERPWQSLSTRLMWRPTPSVRFDSLATYDPNTSRFFALTNSLRFRARNDFALDILSRYDPQQGKFSQINTQFDFPLGRSWRLLGLLRYNGFSGKFESQNLQIVHEWDCLEASFTYSENPFSFRPDRQFYFTLRIKAFPFFRSFDRGPAGQALGPGLGDLF